MQVPRRRFLQSGSAIPLMSGLSQLGCLRWLPQVSAQEAAVDPQIVRFSRDIEPLVQIIEERPRDALLEEIGQRIRRGTSYREIVAALLLAGVRNIQPRPSVGFKFHAVLVVNSAHLASIASPNEHRWLPIFWALDAFKSSQAQDVQEGNWTMKPVEEKRVPSPHKAERMLTDAMDRWDEESADVAVVGMTRGVGANLLFDRLARYGCRDFRSIGHKAIYVANAWRTLNCIGWQYAEPVLRSLVYALLNHHNEDNPAQHDFEADRPGRQNQARLKKFRDDWLAGEVDAQATRDLLTNIYSGTADEMCDHVTDIINRGVSPQSVWDALFVGAGELLVRQPGILGLHTLTATNALHYAFRTCGDDETRRLLMLQSAAFLPMFRASMHNRGPVGDFKIESLQSDAIPADEIAALDAIFADVSQDRMQAAQKVLAYAQNYPTAREFINRARLLIFFKGFDAHDYKFSSAVLEDYQQISDPWRHRYLAASVFNLKGSRDRDNPLGERTRQALARG